MRQRTRYPRAENCLRLITKKSHLTDRCKKCIHQNQSASSIEKPPKAMLCNVESVVKFKQVTLPSFCQREEHCIAKKSHPRGSPKQYRCMMWHYELLMNLEESDEYKTAMPERSLYERLQASATWIHCRRRHHMGLLYRKKKSIKLDFR